MYIVKKFFKSIFSIITTLTIAVSCVSCSDKSNASIEGIPVQLEDEKAWSIVSPDGEILVKMRLKHHQVLSIMDDLLFMKKMVSMYMI